jgi:hypothetical protein
MDEIPLFSDVGHDLKFFCVGIPFSELGDPGFLPCLTLFYGCQSKDSTFQVLDEATFLQGKLSTLLCSFELVHHLSKNCHGNLVLWYES